MLRPNVISFANSSFLRSSAEQAAQVATARAGCRVGHTGSVTVMQRAGSGLNVNLHFHTLVLDGVFTEAPGGALALAMIRHRVQRLLVRRGLEPSDDAPGSADPLADESPIMAGIVGASVQGRVALGSRAGARVRRLGEARDTAAVTSREPRQAVHRPTE